jgi:hypothetical protein
MDRRPTDASGQPVQPSHAVRRCAPWGTSVTLFQINRDRDRLS